MFFKCTFIYFLQFAITYFKYPSSRDFINSTIIEDKNITTKFINKENYTVLVYLAIKPHVYIPAKITYTIESLISLCVQWEKNTSQWQPACYVSIVLAVKLERSAEK